MSSWRASSGRLAGNRRTRVSGGQWARARLRGRCVAPHTWHVATPDVGSTSRKLAQPLVRQNGREGDWAATARRRRRRMELARPAYVEVAERDIMGFLVLSFFLARRRRGRPGLRPSIVFRCHAGIGRERSIVRAVPGSVRWGKLDRRRHFEPTTSTL